MAVVLSRNLKLRIDSNLTANARYNLERIDLLASTFLTDSTNSVNLRSETDISIEPESADIGGSGVGGTVSIGSASHSVTTKLYGTVDLSSAVGLLDRGTSGTRYLRIAYNSTLNGAVDTATDRILSIDLDGADRSLILGADFSLFGSAAILRTTAATDVTLPTTGILATLAGTETLTGKSMSGSSNTFSSIGYSSLVLTGSVVNADISASAAIAYSKLSLSNSLTNGDIAAGAAIAYSKLALTGSVVDADVSSSAAIARSKIASGSASHVVIHDGAGALSSEAQLSISRGGTGASTANQALNALLPSQSGNAGFVLRTDGTDTSWVAAAGTGTVNKYAETWALADGTTKVITHSLGSPDVLVQLIDLADNRSIDVDTVEVTDSNSITLTSSEAPSASGWRVVVLA